MPKRIQLPDGNIGEFPDSMPDAQIEAVLQKQFPAKSSAPTGTIGPVSQRERFMNPDLYPVGVKGEGVGENLKNLAQLGGVGIFKLANAAMTPRQTLAGMEASVLPEPAVKGANWLVDQLNRVPGMSHLTTKLPEGTQNPIRSAYEAVAPGGWEAAGNIAPTAGQMLAGGVLGDVATGVSSDIANVPKAVSPALRSGLEKITKTTPKETAELVKKTQEENAASAATATEKNAAQAAKRTQQVQQHFEKTQAAKEANEVTQNARDRKVALERGVEHLDPEVKTELEGVEKRINAEANKKYTDLRSVLKDEQADPYQAVDEEGHVKGNPVSMVEHLYDVANEPLRGTETETPIIKSLGKRTENGEVDLTYNDLQGYREEVGRELRKGSLPPDVFTAYKRLLTGIDDAMDQIAARKGLKPQQDAARAYYRQYAETFLDRDSPVRKAIDAPEHGTIKQFIGKDQTGVEQIAKYDPALARRINTIRGYQSEARGIRPSTAPPKESLPLPPKPAPIVAKVSNIGPEDVRAAKTESLTERAENIRNKGGGWANTFVILDAIRNAIHGNMAGIGSDLAVRGIFGVGKQGIANLLERPEVVKFLTEPTAKDIAQIPPELRRDFGPIAKAAQARGIKVSPKLLALSAVATPRHPTLSAASPVQ